MLSGNKRIKLRENKTDGSLGFARYSITVGVPASEEQCRQTSFDILSALKQDSDAIMEINSSLFNMNKNERDEIALLLLEDLKDLGLHYRYRKVSSVASPSFFSMLLGKKESQAHEFLVYIPDTVWQSENFKSLMPAYGARYYFLKESTDSGKVFDDMYRMLDSEKLNYFRLIVFDSGMLGSMGINTNSMDVKDIKSLLGLQSY